MKISDENLIRISKFLRRVLKKEPKLIGISISKDGWTEINELIRLSAEYQLKNNYIQLTDEILDDIVNKPSDGIKRYEISDDGWSIRYILSDENETLISKSNLNTPDFLYYVCCEKDINNILKNNLKPLSFSKTVELYEDKIHAWNESALIFKNKRALLQINYKQMVADGKKEISTTHGIWSFSKISSEYITVKAIKNDQLK